MNQFYLCIVIIIVILFLMYVYKKQCDEDYYLSLIRFTQQQCQYNFPPHLQYNYGPDPPQYYNMKQNYFQDFNQINDNNGYKTPKRKKSFHIYRDFSGLNNSSSSPTINFTNNHFIREKIVLNNLRNNNNYCNNDDYPHNQNGNINKKIFKLEDFLTDSKMKNSINNYMNDDCF